MKKGNALKLPKLPLVLTCLAVTVALDQFTKVLAKDTLSSRPPLVYLGGFFRLEYTENSGAFLGMGSQLPDALRFWVFGIGVAVLLIWLTYHVVKSEMGLARTLGLCLMIGGGVGNLIDRLLTGPGRVIDFMNLGIGSLRTGIFNVADVAIMVGIGLLLLESGKKHTHEGQSSGPHSSQA